MSEWTFAPAALAAVSAAALAVMAVAGGLGRHVYDELLRDVRTRTRDNAWDTVAAFDPFIDDADDQAVVEDDILDIPDIPDMTDDDIELSDERLEAAVNEARAEAAAELDRIRHEADEKIAAALRAAQAESERRLESAVEASRVAAAAELAHVQQEAAMMTTRLQQERAEAHLQHEATVRDMRAAAAAELARVKQEAERTLAIKLEEVRAMAPQPHEVDERIASVRLEAERALASTRERVQADADRQRDAAIREVKAAAEAEIARVKHEAEAATAAKIKQVLIDSAREREAAVRKAEAAAASELTRVREAADAALAAAEAKAHETARPLPPPAEPLLAPVAATGHQTLEEHLKEARAKVAHLRGTERRQRAAR